MRRIILTASLCFALTGCAGGCMKELAATEAGITTAYSSVKTAYNNNVIGRDDKNKAVKIIDAANAAADSALPLCKIDDPRAMDYVRAAQIGIQNVNQIVKVK